MSEPGRSAISFRTALLLYAVLVLVSLATLKGNVRLLALVIIGGLLAKSIVHYYRERLE